MTFKGLLKSLAKQFKTKTAFAQALGLHPSHLSRAMGKRGEPFDVSGCLRLALVTGTPASTVLRIAGKGDLVALLEQAYGAPRELLSADEQELLRIWTAMSPTDRRAYLDIGHAVVGRALVSPQPQGGPRRSDPSTPPKSSGGHVMQPEPVAYPRRARSG